MKDGKGGHLTEEEMQAEAKDVSDSVGKATRLGRKPYDWTVVYLARLELTAQKLVAATDAGVTLGMVGRRRTKDADFAAREQEAMRSSKDLIESEFVRRAVTGYEEPVFGSLGKGMPSGIVGSVRKFSDTLLIRLAERSETGSWRQKQQIEQTSTVQFATRAERKAHLEKVRAEMAADRARDNRS